MPLDEIIDGIRAAVREIAERDGSDDEPCPPAEPPASEAAIAAAQRVRGREFPAHYVAFLREHDGWRGFGLGDRNLFGNN